MAQLKHLKIAILGLIVFIACYGWIRGDGISGRLNVSTVDGTVANYPYKLTVSNGSLTDNGDGTMNLTLVVNLSTPTFGSSPVSNAYFLNTSNYLWQTNGSGFPNSTYFGPGNGTNLATAQIAFGTGNLTSASNNGQYNNVFGTSNLQVNNTGTNNFVMGLFNANATTSGSFNFLMGDHVLQNNATSPQDNVMLGSTVGTYLTTANRNEVIGKFAVSNTAASSLSDSVCVGYDCGTGITSSARNVMVGNYAGYGVNATTPTTTGTDNVFIGYDATQSAATQSNNCIAMGSGARCSGSNTAQIGGQNGSGKEVMLYVTSITVVSQTLLGNGKFQFTGSGINGISVAGQGFDLITATGSATAQTGAVASVTAFTTSSSGGSFEVGGYIDVTAFTAGTVSLNCDYTDPSGTARTLTIPLVALAGTISSSVGSATDAQAVVTSIQTSGANSIKLYTTVSIFTGTYNVYLWLKEIV